MPIHTRPWLPGHFHWRWRKAQAVKSQLTQYFIKIKAKVTLDKNPRNNEAYERKAQQNERTDLSLESFEILCTWNTQKISFTGNTERSLSAPDTHFHQKLQLKHQTTDIHAHVNRMLFIHYYNIIMLCNNIIYFTVNWHCQYSFEFTGFYPTSKAVILKTYYILHCSTHLSSATGMAPI